MSKMRVLWFSPNSANYKLPSAETKGYNGGGWTASLQKELVKNDDITLGVCFCMNDQPDKTEQEGVAYYPVPCHAKRRKDKLLDLTHYKDTSRDEILWPYYINHFKRVIRDFNPDVIQVFGSELYIGLATIAAKELNIPCCLHIQGILSLSIYTFLPAGMSKWSYYLSQGIKKAFDKFQYLTYWQRSVYREKAILKAVPHVIGRTEWDRQAMTILAPQARYHYGGEILRSCFYDVEERKIPQKTVITTTSSIASYKGFDLILKIAYILKNEMHLDFSWNVYGNINPCFFEKLTGINHKDVNIKLCGVASAEQLKKALLNSTLYCHTSYTENSSISIAEAQMLGLPIVATNVGGTSSMVTHAQDGYLYPSNDPYMATYYILQLVTDKKKNILLGQQSRQKAMKRHDRNDIVLRLIETYDKIVKGT